MREIKFKIWYQKTKEMSVSINVWNLPDIDMVMLNKPILLQYTGLKDKNGIDIYEGDIMRIKEHKVTKHETGRVITIPEQLAVVVFKDTEFRAENKKRIFPLNFTHTEEVIGNIYENPELISKSQTIS